MITVTTYSNATEAYIAKGLLESNGIRCWLKGDLISQALPLGNIELQVNAEDLERARDLLENTADSD